MLGRNASVVTRGIVYSVLVAYLIVTILPLYWIIITTFKEPAEAAMYPPTLIPRSITLQNIVFIFTESRVFGVRPFYSSLVISLGTSLLAAVVSFLAGYGFSRYRFPGRDAVLLSLLLMNFLPLLAILIPVFRLFILYRLYDTYLGLILLHGFKTAPFTAWLMKNYVDTLPLDLEESAMIDGCSSPQAMRRIVAPLAAPGLAAVAVLGFRQAWNDFTAALILTTSADVRPYTIALYRFVGEHGRVEWHLLSAAAFISVIPVVISFAFFQRYFVSGLTGGALKS